METISKIPLVVARKGVRGFHKTSKIDESTTICDSRLQRTEDLWVLVLSLTGFDPNSQSHDLDPRTMPMVFSNPKKRLNNRNDWIPQITHVFKFARGGKFIRIGKQIVYEGILVDNSNNHYEVRVDNMGLVNRLKKVESAVVEVKKPLVSTNVEPVRTRKEAITIEMYPSTHQKKQEESATMFQLLLAQ